MSIQIGSSAVLVYNVKKYGARGDGSYHPLSGTYATLAAAQAVYPRATDLGETFDWHGHQLAIDTALAAGGGKVYSPAGHYRMDGNSIPAPSALKYPIFNDRQILPTPTSTAAEVNHFGDGDNVTILEWQVDKGTIGNLGSTEYGVMCGNQAGDPNNQQADSRYGSNVMCAGETRDLALVGPTYAALGDSGSRQAGTVGCNMSGFCWGGRRRLTRVRFTGWWAGHDVVGDHTHFDGCKYYGNYYDVYVNHSSPTVYGDLSWGEKCMFESTRMAAFGFHYGGDINKASFANHCYFGNNPFVFFFEATPLSGGNPSLPTGFTEKTTKLSGVKMDMPHFESGGHGIIWDDNITVNGAARFTLDGLAMVRPNFDLWNDNKLIAARGNARNWISVAQTNGVTIEKIYEMVITAFTRPAIEVTTTAIGDFLMEGDIEAFIAACAANVVSSVSSPIMPVKPPSDVYARRFKFRHHRGTTGVGSWEGKLHATFTSDTVNAGHFVGTKFNGVRPMVESDNTVMATGIARSAAFPNNPGVGGTQSYAIIAEEGDHIPFTTVAPSNAATLQKVSTAYGGLTDAGTDNDGRIVGYASSTAGFLNLAKSARTMPNANDRKRTVRLLGVSDYTLAAGTAGYTLLATDRGKPLGFSYSGAQKVTVAAVSAGGSGYTVGDVLTVVGGTSTVVATLTVATLGASNSVATVTITNSGSYTVNPTNAVSVTGGTGTGATFNLTLALIPLLLTLPNSFAVGYEFEFWQHFTNVLSWAAASGGSVDIEGSISTAEARWKVYVATVIANSGGAAAEWLIHK